jgi:DNA replication protein DnaC
MSRIPTTYSDPLCQRAYKLGLYGLVNRWPEFGHEPWVSQLVDCEEAERQHRSLERRMRRSKVGAFKVMADFDWKWPTKGDRELIEELFTFQFLDEAANVVLVGANGVGKTMIAQNLAHQAVQRGHTAIFTTASAMLNDLSAQDGALALQRRLRHYATPKLLVIDEVGYLSYDNRHADLLFEVVNRRYGQRSIVLTTNKPFAEWNDMFPNAACVVTLIDRLVHKAEIVQLAADGSYRFKEATERQARRSTRKKPDT